MTSQKFDKNPQSLPYNILNNNTNIGFNPSQQKTHDWVAIYLDDKFFLTTQSAYERVQTLDNQIAQEKEKLQKLNLNNNQKMEGLIGDNRQLQIQEYKKRKNSLESAQSRECKTEINEFKALKAKFQIQRQLIEEQMNFQNKTLEVRKRRQLKEATTFLIRNPRQKSSQFKQIRSKKSKNNYMLAPHELSKSNRKNQQKQHEKEIQPFNLSEDEQGMNYKTLNQNLLKNQKRILENNNTVKMSLNSQSRYQQIQPNKKQASKSKQKSFVITSRKLSSAYSKQKDSSFRANNESKKSSYPNSQAQLQKLNGRLKQMQKKLISVEKKQQQLQDMEKKKQINQHSAHTDTSKDFYSINNETVENDGKIIAQSSYKKKKVEKCLKKEQKQIGNQKESLKYKKKQEVKRDERATIFTIREQKYKRLGITSQTVAYNYNEQKERNEKENDETQVKQKMSKEIQELKKTIKQLKIEKIKQETVISELERKDKSNINENEGNNNEITFNGEDLYSRSNIKSHSNSNSMALSEKSLLESLSPKQEELSEQKKQEDNLQTIQMNENKPLLKKQPRRLLKFDVNSVYKKKLTTSLNNSYHQTGSNGVSIHYERNKQQGSDRIQSQNKILTSAEVKKQGIKNEQKRYDNPQQQTKQACYAIKGKIIKQNFNKHKLHSISSNNQSQKEITFESNHTKQKTGDPSNQNQARIHCLNQQFSYPQIIIPEIQSIESFPIPELPSPPSLETQQSEILAHAKKICQIFQIKIKSSEQLQFKKFKNCILLKTLSNNRAIVWHFSGKFYIGGWEQKSQSGEDHKNGEGFQFIPEKHYYRGQFLHGKKNGYGTMIMLNGNIYKGQWQNGERHGKGILYEKINSSYYDGYWKAGKKQGKGIYKISDKQFYTGTFQNSLKEGQGFQLFGNGDIYEGCYKNGKFNGKGKYFWSNGSAYVGDFVDGQRSGYGKWISSLSDGDIYIGQYQKDKKQGKGKYIWFTGCIFQGNFLCDLKHGQGKVEYPDGRQVKGVWQQGKLKNIYKSQYQGQSRVESQNFYLQTEPRIRPNIPRIEETPSKMMQQSRIIHGV